MIALHHSAPAAGQAFLRFFAAAMSDGVSSRAVRLSSFDDPVRDSSTAVDENPYHETDNPEGVIDMCMSQNSLISDVMVEKLNQPDMLKWDPAMLLYPERRGTKRLREAVADFLSDQTGAAERLDPEKIIIMNGVTAIMSIIAYVLCEDGDSVLCPGPSYYSIPRDIWLISNVKTFPIKLTSKPGPNGRQPFELTVDQLEQGLQEAKQQGHKVKALFLVNPSNPLGIVYTRDQVLAYLEFCKRHNLHAIMDEIYQCSIYDKSTSNSSVLGLKYADIPDPQRTHALYGFSKDFALPGAPVSVLYSWNKDVLAAFGKVCDFHQASSFIQAAVAKILEDKEWLNNVFFPTNLSRTLDACQFTMAALDDLGVTYVTPSAGLYLWANFGKFLVENTRQEEDRLNTHFIQCGVVFSPSAGFMGGEYGWFRVMFTIPRPRLIEGLKRLKKACATFSHQTDNVAH